MPEGHFKIQRQAYKQFMQECQNGDLAYVRLTSKEHDQSQTSNVILFGANFDDEYPLKNLYKALNVVRPDALLLQVTPDVAL